ncbi:hypothetical protein PHPALM_28239, partial [Phytophthora palmivora]
MGFEIVLDEATMLSLLEGCDMAEDVDAIPSVVIDSLPRRKQSEEENRKLKEQMKAKIWQAKMLLKGFKRRLRNEVVGSSIKLCRRYGVDASGVTMPTNNDAVFYDLMLGTDEMYAVVDDFFEKMGMDEEEEISRQVKGSLWNFWIVMLFHLVYKTLQGRFGN